VKKSYFFLDTTVLPFVPKRIPGAATLTSLYALARFPAGSEATLPRFTRQSWYATSIGAATAIDEYVPIKIPTTRANENPCNTSPPNKYNDKTVKNVRPDEITVRLSV
jgi:hypothetical protein